jgi:membrane protease YdiL (CAAX protease family)
MRSTAASTAEYGRVAVTVAIVTVFALLPLLPLSGHVWVIGALISLALIAGLLGDVLAAQMAAFCALTGLLIGSVGATRWPLPLVLALTIYGGGARLYAPARRGFGWLRRGGFGPPERRLVLLTVLVSAVGLIIWYRLAHPDVAAFRTRIPSLPLALLAVAGLTFATVNAAAEEAVFRGVIQWTLESSVGAGVAALLLQALAFGLWHVKGFPRGGAGVVLAFVYGLMLGVIRRQAGGMLAPWAAHVGADLTIFGILVAVG